MNKPWTCEIIKPASAREDNHSNFSITENWKVFGFLQQTISSLRESHLPVCGILNPFHHNLPSSHISSSFYSSNNSRLFLRITYRSITETMSGLKSLLKMAENLSFLWIKKDKDKLYWSFVRFNSIIFNPLIFLKLYIFIFWNTSIIKNYT